MANLAGALLDVPVVVGAGYAVGYGFGAYVERLRYLVEEVERIVLLIVLVGILDLGAACVVQGVRRRGRTCVAAATGRGAGPVTAASRLSGLRLPRSRRSPAGAPRCPE